MEIALQIIQTIVTLALGGGLHWFVSFRRKKQRTDTSLAVEEYNDTDDFIDKTNARIKQLFDELNDMRQKDSETRSLIQEQNLLINRFKKACTCGAKDVLL
jgi:transcription initiation factor IIE alpha subunit